MSFDVHLQGFAAGEASGTGGDLARSTLAPYVVREDGAFLLVRHGDGEADVYLHDDGMMANHLSGRDVWDVVVECARSAGWAIMPIGHPTCVTSADLVADLPEELADGAVVVATGADLLDVVTSG
ncbi:hypothetical protein [Nocardioides mangrovi]|uniref:Uncharacterized protein n=1 Tax=Nocardioides mangrovi TaxID=2874580 RepID=A0ABS7U731_9ACTN|nr:hypothetical protein [Nocardioides mangrovi]MBZ5736780.1 hypothetical protein [Nocardioides mangrovi]